MSYNQKNYGYVKYASSGSSFSDVKLSQPIPSSPATRAQLCYINSGTISLAWASVSGASGYVVQICRNTQFIGPTLKATNVGNNTSHDITVGTDVWYGGKYHWRVFAYSDTGGASPKSEAFEFTILCPDTGEEDPEDPADASCTTIDASIIITGPCGDESGTCTVDCMQSFIVTSQGSWNDSSWSINSVSWAITGPGQIVQSTTTSCYITIDECSEGKITLQQSVEFSKSGSTSFTCKSNKLEFEVTCPYDDPIYEQDSKVIPDTTYSSGSDYQRIKYLYDYKYSLQTYSEHCGEYYSTYYDVPWTYEPCLGDGLYNEGGSSQDCIGVYIEDAPNGLYFKNGRLATYYYSYGGGSGGIGYIGSDCGVSIREVVYGSETYNYFGLDICDQYSASSGMHTCPTYQKPLLGCDLSEGGSSCGLVLNYHDGLTEDCYGLTIGMYYTPNDDGTAYGAWYYGPLVPVPQNSGAGWSDTPSSPWDVLDIATGPGILPKTGSMSPDRWGVDEYYWEVNSQLRPRLRDTVGLGGLQGFSTDANCALTVDMYDNSNSQYSMFVRNMRNWISTSYENSAGSIGYDNEDYNPLKIVHNYYELLYHTDYFGSGAYSPWDSDYNVNPYNSFYDYLYLEYNDNHFYSAVSGVGGGLNLYFNQENYKLSLSENDYGVYVKADSTRGLGIGTVNGVYALVDGISLRFNGFGQMESVPVAECPLYTDGPYMYWYGNVKHFKTSACQAEIKFYNSTIQATNIGAKGLYVGYDSARGLLHKGSSAGPSEQGLYVNLMQQIADAGCESILEFDDRPGSSTGGSIYVNYDSNTIWATCAGLGVHYSPVYGLEYKSYSDTFGEGGLGVKLYENQGGLWFSGQSGVAIESNNDCFYFASATKPTGQRFSVLYNTYTGLNARSSAGGLHINYINSVYANPDTGLTTYPLDVKLSTVAGMASAAGGLRNVVSSPLLIFPYSSTAAYGYIGVKYDNATIYVDSATGELYSPLTQFPYSEGCGISFTGYNISTRQANGGGITCLYGELSTVDPIMPLYKNIITGGTALYYGEGLHLMPSNSYLAVYPYAPMIIDGGGRVALDYHEYPLIVNSVQELDFYYSTTDFRIHSDFGYFTLRDDYVLTSYYSSFEEFGISYISGAYALRMVVYNHNVWTRFADHYCYTEHDTSTEELINMGICQ